jgi:peroxiredoxin Q/BCP
MIATVSLARMVLPGWTVGVPAGGSLRERVEGSDGPRTTPGEPLTTKHLQVGDLAPDFSLPSDTGETVTLSSLRGQKVVVYFYPTAMTTGCTTQACDFRDSLDSLKAAGYTVLGISPDRLAKLAEFREHDRLTFPLLSDADRSVMNDWGTYGEKQQYGKTVLGVIRSTFVVDEDGRIEIAQYNVKATGHVAKLRRELGV